MAEKALRGMGLGSSSYENDRDVALAARSERVYHCPNSHSIRIPFAHGVTAPVLWECPRCGAEAVLDGETTPEKAAPKPVRTHWDMLLERRSIYELQLLLEERLALLRGEGKDAA